MTRQRAAFVWCELVCRECARASHGRFTRYAIPRVALVNEAKKAGWQFAHDESFCSTECLAKFENVNKEPS